VRSALKAVLLCALVSAPTLARADDISVCFKDSGQTAIDACTRVITRSSSKKQDRVDAYVNRGQEYYVLKDYTTAISDFDMAIKLNPNEILAHGNRANCFYMLKKHDEAIAGYTRAISLDSGYTSAYTGRGLAREAMGEKTAAIADYKKALSAKQKYQDGAWAHKRAAEKLKEHGVD